MVFAPTPSSGEAAATSSNNAVNSSPRRAVAPRTRNTTAPAQTGTQLSTAQGSALTIPADIAEGYAAFQRGEYAAARLSYERAARAEPNNADALHGLAAIYLKAGQPKAAEDIYRRLLNAHPWDATALSAIVALSPADPASEYRLKSALSARPNAHPLSFTLGNLYASQARWGEAQQAYFNAYTAAPDNPDYQFNLAVSLEHMKKPTLALKYYEAAQQSAAGRSASFDAAALQTRIKALKETAP